MEIKQKKNTRLCVNKGLASFQPHQKTICAFVL